MNEFFQE